LEKVVIWPPNKSLRPDAQNRLLLRFSGSTGFPLSGWPDERFKDVTYLCVFNEIDGI
jgi:hypothetical protein